MHSSLKFCVAVAACGLASPVFAGTVKSINVDGDFSDWTGVPIVITDDAFDAAPVDITTVQIANDATNLYLRINYSAAANPNSGGGFFLGFDTDMNPATGYHVRGLATFGSEAGFQNDFPFDQRGTAGTFNTGTISAGAGIAPFNVSTDSQEYRIPRNITYGNDGANVFGNSFRLVAYSDGQTTNDITPFGDYTFAAAPEPTTLMAAVSAIALCRRRRSR